jgi:hypothetical protein
MVLDWTTLTIFLTVFFAISGFLRGWWKEAFTTVFLAFLVFLLKQPDTAEWLVGSYNSIVAFIWGYIPTNVTTVSANDTDSIVAISLSAPPDMLVIDPTSGSTWFYMLLLAVGIPTLWTRSSFNNQPTNLGKLLGIGVGGFNGLLIMGVLREYLDGRALPHGEGLAETGIILSSGSGSAATREVAITATNLPTYTILDSMVPWVIIIVAALLFFAFFKTRVTTDGKKIIYNLPPMYK